MTNPVTKFELRDFAPDDISKVMENFFDVVSWATTESVHVHHIQTFTVDASGQAAGASTTYSGTWPTAYPSGVVPVVMALFNSTSGSPINGDELTGIAAFNISNTGCSVRVKNNWTSALATGSIIAVIGFDMSFNTALA